jgi:chromosome segregation ATPase
VLPDLHRLLNEYKESRGLLSAKDMLVQQAEKEHEEKLTRLRIELDANKKEYEKVIQSVVGERGKLEREAVVLRQQVADLQALAGEHEKLKTEVLSLQDSHKNLETGIENLRTTNEELLSSKAAQEREIQNVREGHSQQITELQKQHEDRLAAKEKEHQQALSEQKTILSKTQLDLAGLISKHANLKNELENSRNLQNDHKSQLDAKAKELDETHARHAEEIDAVKKSQEEDHSRSLGALEAKNAKIVEDHNRKEQKWMQELEILRTQMQNNNEDLEKERKEHQALKATRKKEQDRASELARGIANWKAKHAELQTEHENVDRLLQSLRLVNQAKPKGDNFL